MYGKNHLFPIEFEINTLRTMLQVNFDLETTQKQWLNHLNELDEKRLVAIQQTNIIQQQRAKWHNRFIKMRSFKKDIGLYYMIQDSRISRGSSAPSG